MPLGVSSGSVAEHREVANEFAAFLRQTATKLDMVPLRPASPSAIDTLNAFEVSANETAVIRAKAAAEEARRLRETKPQRMAEWVKAEQARIQGRAKAKMTEFSGTVKRYAAQLRAQVDRGEIPATYAGQELRSIIFEVGDSYRYFLDDLLNEARRNFELEKRKP